jgi:hypothetical protein
MMAMYAPAPARGGGPVRLNVGGRVFETTTDTLAIVGRDTMLGAMLSSSWNAPASSGGGVAEYFIDRDPTSFAVLLDLLRTGALHLPPGLPLPALYYGLLERPSAPRPAAGAASCTAAPCACTAG